MNAKKKSLPTVTQLRPKVLRLLSKVLRKRLYSCADTHTDTHKDTLSQGLYGLVTLAGLK